MAVTPSVVSMGDLDAASSGNPALRNLLQSLAQAANTQATKTSTSSKTPPNQSKATVAYQAPFYVLTFTDPGGASALTPAQAAAAAQQPLGSNSSLSNLYHQVQAATSVLFDAASNVVTYGGANGSLQTQFVISDLDTTKQWYFRFCTSYDGQNWTAWKIISNNATIANRYAVTAYPINGGRFAAITAIGAQTLGFGMGQVPSAQGISSAGGVPLAETIGIAAPAGVNDTGHRVSSIQECSINAEGIATLEYSTNGVDGVHDAWDGALNFLTFGFAKGNQNLAYQTLGDGGKWCLVTLAGGAQIAIGSGVANSGATIDLPAGFTAGNSMGVATPAVGADSSNNLAHGIKQSNYAAGLVTVLYGDGSGNQWTSTGNWFVIAWPAALAGNLVAVAGGQYLKLPTPSGNVMIGVGATASGGILPLPAGYSYQECLAFSTPGSYNDIGSYMHGVKICTVDVGLEDSLGTVTMIYTDGTEAVWNGNANWFTVAWL